MALLVAARDARYSTLSLRYAVLLLGSILKQEAWLQLTTLRIFFHRVRIVLYYSPGAMPTIHLEVQEEMDEKLKEQLEKLGLLSKVKIDKGNAASVEAAAKRMAAK